MPANREFKNLRNDLEATFINPVKKRRRNLGDGDFERQTADAQQASN